MKNNKHDNNHEFDETFNERFSDFQFNPNPDFFERIQSKMDPNEFDQEVKTRFDEFSVMPSDKVWKSVQPNLPLHLGLRIQLQRLTRVAAVVLFVMTGLYLYQFQQDQTLVASAETISPSEEGSITVTSVAKTDFVFEVPESVPMEEAEDNKASKKLRKKKKSQQKRISDYLALILEEEDDFDAFIDHKKMKELLQPVEKLSPDFMSASALAPLPRYESYSVAIQDIELNINIPLQVVEPHEVDDLIRLYDQNQQAERD